MSWLSKIFGGKKQEQEAKVEAPVSAPAEPVTSEVPMTGIAPEAEEEKAEEPAAAEESVAAEEPVSVEETEEAGSEEMK